MRSDSTDKRSDELAQVSSTTLLSIIHDSDQEILFLAIEHCNSACSASVSQIRIRHTGFHEKCAFAACRHLAVEALWFGRSNVLNDAERMYAKNKYRKSVRAFSDKIGVLMRVVHCVSARHECREIRFG